MDTQESGESFARLGPNLNSAKFKLIYKRSLLKTRNILKKISRPQAGSIREKNFLNLRGSSEKKKNRTFQLLGVAREVSPVQFYFS